MAAYQYVHVMRNLTKIFAGGRAVLSALTL